MARSQTGTLQPNWDNPQPNWDSPAAWDVPCKAGMTQ